MNVAANAFDPTAAVAPLPAGGPREDIEPLHNVTLEISPKPFVPNDDASVERIMCDLGRQWWPLLRHARRVSVLFWLGDGTDILEYRGRLGDRVEWAKWMGYAHTPYKVSIEEDPLRESIVTRGYLYREDAPEITYADVKRMVAAMKRAIRTVVEVPVEVGIPFDPGSEFSVAPFRYEKHPEILITGGGAMRMIDCTARLGHDPDSFAGFPDGIPKGLPFGTFLGRQTQCYLCDLGFDYVWFSNSFGFGRSPYAWGAKGQFFDGDRFTSRGNRELADAVAGFWKQFRLECPSARVENRGTDFSAGMNLVNHATDYQAIYAAAGDTSPQPNTPWPALTGNHGIALAGWLSQVAGYDGESFPMRFYLSDPWWCNSPWVDRFDRSPHDIYLSMAMCRVDADGQARPVNDVKILSVDTAWGEIPESFPVEVLPHLRRGLVRRPDRAPPLLWVYPFEPYHRYTFEQNRLEEVFFGDLFIQEAVNRGLPLGGVLNSEDFVRGMCGDNRKYLSSVLLSPVPEADSLWERALLDHMNAGGHVLAYGPLVQASERFKKAAGLKIAEGISGQLALDVQDEDVYLQPGRNRSPHVDPSGIDHAYKASEVQRVESTSHLGPPPILIHDPVLAAGPACEVAEDSCEVLARMRDAAGAERAAATVRGQRGGGRLAWVRGSPSALPEALQGRSLRARDPSLAYPGEHLLRLALGRLGWSFRIRRLQVDPRAAHVIVSRHRNGFVFTGHSNDSSVDIGLSGPLGMPVTTGGETELANGTAWFRCERWFHRDCRVFVTQCDGLLWLSPTSPKHFRYRNRWMLTGLKDATLRFFPLSGLEEHTNILLNPCVYYYTRGESYDGSWVEHPLGRFWEMRNVSGMVTFAW
ncbi:MAG: hypothetical protein HS116_06325 [Planctomycetes bacterium]|nr:hypothetical protein [Planctomycetota bacterium]